MRGEIEYYTYCRRMETSSEKHVYTNAVVIINKSKKREKGEKRNTFHSYVHEYIKEKQKICRGVWMYLDLDAATEVSIFDMRML